MNRSAEYMTRAIETAQRAAREQEDAVLRAARAAADALAGGGMLYTFGTGHSHLLAEEIFYRAGGLVRVRPIQDEPLMLHAGASKSTAMERLPGYAAILLGDVPGLRAGDVLFLFANSGRNTVCVDMALLARERGLVTVGVTSLAHSAGVASRHPSGKRLFEVCDIVIDNGGVPGDACVDIDGRLCGPTSTVVGAMLMQAVVCGTVELLIRRGEEPEVFTSSNLDGGDAVNRRYIEKYRSVIPML